jgi:predicted Zn-dependent protease
MAGVLGHIMGRHSMKFGRDDELESDRLGVNFVAAGLSSGSDDRSDEDPG